jgi:hypothetical protein
MRTRTSYQPAWPSFAAMPALPGTKAERPAWIAYFAGGRPR